MKKQIEKQFGKLQKMIERIEEYNEYIQDNKYYNYHKSYLSFDVKLHNTYLCDDEVFDALKKLYPDMAEGEMQQVIEEFNDDRLTGIVYHFYDREQEDFKELLWMDETHPNKSFIKGWDIGFYGRGGGHLCLGDIDSFELDVFNTEVGEYPVSYYDHKYGMQWKFSDDDLIQQFKEHFGVTTQKEVYLQLKKDIEGGNVWQMHQDAIDNQKTLEELEARIDDYKANARKYLIEQLEYEIENFVENEFDISSAIEMAEKGDRSKLQHINTVTEGEVITNMQAKVPTEKAKLLLEAIIKGDNVIGVKIGAYTVNRIEKRTNDTYVKIGCHILSLNEAIHTLKQ